MAPPLAGRKKREALTAALSDLIVPCFFTTATTAAGLLSLRLSDIRPIAEFGTIGALGVCIAFVVSMTHGPALLVAFRPPSRGRLARVKSARVSRLIGWMVRSSKRRDRVVLATAGAVVTAMLIPIGNLKVGVNPLSYFKPDAPIRVDTEKVEETLGGTTSLELIVRGGQDTMLEPRLLADLNRIETGHEGAAISHGISAIDSLKEMTRLWTDGRLESATVLDTRQKAAQLYLTIESEDDFERMVTDSYGTGRVTLRSTLSSASELRESSALLSKQADELAATHGLDVQVTGYVQLMSEMYEYLLASQIRTLLAAFLVITLMLAFLLRSLRLALFGLIPNDWVGSLRFRRWPIGAAAHANRRREGARRGARLSGRRMRFCPRARSDCHREYRGHRWRRDRSASRELRDLSAGAIQCELAVARLRRCPDAIGRVGIAGRPCTGTHCSRGGDGRV